VPPNPRDRAGRFGDVRLGTKVGATGCGLHCALAREGVIKGTKGTSGRPKKGRWHGHAALLRDAAVEGHANCHSAARCASMTQFGMHSEVCPSAAYTGTRLEFGGSRNIGGCGLGQPEVGADADEVVTLRSESGSIHESSGSGCSPEAGRHARAGGSTGHAMFARSTQGRFWSRVGVVAFACAVLSAGCEGGPTADDAPTPPPSYTWRGDIFDAATGGGVVGDVHISIREQGEHLAAGWGPFASIGVHPPGRFGVIYYLRRVFPCSEFPDTTLTIHLEFSSSEGTYSPAVHVTRSFRVCPRTLPPYDSLPLNFEDSLRILLQPLR